MTTITRPSRIALLKAARQRFLDLLRAGVPWAIAEADYVDLIAEIAVSK